MTTTTATTTVVIFGEKFPYDRVVDDDDDFSHDIINGGQRIECFGNRTKHHKLFSSNSTHQTEDNTSFDDSTESYSEAFFNSPGILLDDDEDEDYGPSSSNSRRIVEATPSSSSSSSNVVHGALVSKASTLSHPFPKEDRSSSRRQHHHEVPSEIIVIKETTAEELSSSSCCYEDEAVAKSKLEEADCIISYYKEALNHTELVVESLRKGYQESRMNERSLLEERNSLLNIVRDMEEETERCEQSYYEGFSFIISLLMCFGLFFYFWTGSETLLVMAAAVYLFDGFLHRVI